MTGTLLYHSLVLFILHLPRFSVLLKIKQTSEEGFLFHPREPFLSKSVHFHAAIVYSFPYAHTDLHTHTHTLAKLHRVIHTHTDTHTCNKKEL